MTPTPSDDEARLLEELASVPSSTRQTARARAWSVLPAAVAVACALYFVFDRPNRHRPLWFLVVAAASWIVVAALSVLGALGRPRGAGWRSRQALVAVAVGTPVVLLVVMWVLSLAAPQEMVVGAPQGWRCLALTLAAAAVPLLALLRLRRETDPLHPAATGAALGSACGASAGVMVELWCPVAAPSHILFGHLLPIVVLALLGGVMGSRVLRMRRVGKR